MAATTVSAASKLWRRVGSEFQAGWWSVRPEMLAVVTAGRSATVSVALPYTGAVLEETGQVHTPVGVLRPSRFLETAPNGRLVGDVLDDTVIHAKSAVKGGATVAEALASAGSWLSGTLLTMLADTRRDVYGADMIRRPTLAGYTRMLNAPSCSRCVVLAGKWFRWNQGFQRHPRCDCLHIPSNENVAGDFTTDPDAYFGSLSKAEQDRVFTKSGARAIRDGADIYRVENVRLRGLSSSKSRQAIKYGTPTRVTVDDIYRTAGTRANAMRMLEREGYVTGPQSAGGNILGPRVERFAGLDRGKGTVLIGGVQVKTARASVVDARTSGVRDPLNRATMTAGERRIYDDFYRAEHALRGVRPRTIGSNSADRGVVLDFIDQEQADRVRMSFIRRVDRARSTGTPSERRLAELLWARYDALV